MDGKNKSEKFGQHLVNVNNIFFTPYSLPHVPVRPTVSQPKATAVPFDLAVMYSFGISCGW